MSCCWNSFVNTQIIEISLTLKLKEITVVKKEELQTLIYLSEHIYSNFFRIISKNSFRNLHHSYTAAPVGCNLSIMVVFFFGVDVCEICFLRVNIT